MKPTHEVSDFVFFLFAGFLALSTPAQGGVVGEANESSLRAAIQSGGLVTFNCDGIIRLTNTITLDRDVTLDGSGHKITISGNQSVRLFNVASGVHVALMNLILADGWLVGTNGTSEGGMAEIARGGAIFNEGGTVDVLSCILSNHFAKGGIGGRFRIQAGIPGGPFQDGGAAHGGAVYNLAGHINITNSLFVSNNVAGGRDGGGCVGACGGAMPGNGGEAVGACIYSQGGRINLNSTRFSFNYTAGGESGEFMYTGMYAGKGGDAAGGGVYGRDCAVAVDHSSFYKNKVQGGAIQWTGPTSGFGWGGAICLTNSTLTCSNSRFLENLAQGGTQARYSPRGPGRGGAIYCQGEGTISACYFSSNSVASYEGAGGAMYGLGVLRVSACTFANNSARGGGAPAPEWYQGLAGPGWGGAIYGDAQMGITNSTFHNNRAEGGFGAGASTGGTALGGGIFQAAGSAILVHVTLSSNGAIGGKGAGGLLGMNAGGNIYSSPGTLQLFNSIVANSLSNSLSISNGVGNIMDGGHNLCSDGSCNFTNQGSLNNADPMLGPLGDNGGPTPTLALLVGSPAIDAGDISVSPAQDQRGFSRLSGATVDLGAFEHLDLPSIIEQPQSQASVSGRAVQFIVQATNTFPMGYQWLKNGVPIANGGRYFGADTATLTINNVAGEDVGVYTVVVSNYLGGTFSREARLNMVSVAGSWAGEVSAVATGRDYVYVIGNQGFHVIDVRDPLNPSRVGGCQSPGSGNAVTLAENSALVAGGTNGLQMIDIRGPANPVNVGGYVPDRAWEDPVMDVSVSGTRAYLANRVSGLHVIDIGNPENPVRQGGASLPSGALGAFALPPYAYVLTSDLRVFNVENPSNIQLASYESCTELRTPYRVVAANQYAYVATEAQSSGAGDLQVYDVSNPADPVIVGRCGTGISATNRPEAIRTGVAVAGGYALVAHGTAGLHIIDIRNPAQPVSLGDIALSGYAQGVAYGNGFAYVACGTAGLAVVDLGGAIPQQPHLMPPVREGNGWRIRFSGEPNTSFTFLRADSLQGPWMPQTGVFGSNGRAEFFDVSGTVSSAFYRFNAP